MITYEQAIEAFDYDPESGELRWRIKPARNTEAGDVAGCTSNHGYRVVKYKSRRYSIHRIIWLMVHGKFPPNEIDHINGVRDDNRLSNLRAATLLENQRNQKLPSNSKSGVMGVHWQTARNKWHASIRVNYKLIYLGIYEILQDAVDARKAAEIKYGFHSNHGRT